MNETTETDNLAIVPDTVETNVETCTNDNGHGDEAMPEVPQTPEQEPESETDQTLNQVVQKHKATADDKGYVYAVGVLKPVFPNLGLQKTFDAAARVVGVSEYDYYDVFNYLNPNTKQRPYLYIAEQIDWVLSINQKDCYRLLPRSKAELLCFIETLKPLTDSLQEVYSTAIGMLRVESEDKQIGLPKVVCNHFFSQTLDQLHNQLKAQTGVATAAIQDVLKQLEFSPNDGRSDISRAKNYLAFRYPEIYLTTHSLKNQTHQGDSITSFFLESIEANYSDLEFPHVVVDIILIYKSKTTKQQKYYYCSVDVTNQFPFINTPLQSFMPFTPAAS